MLLAYDGAEKERAATCYIQALRIFRAVGDRWQERKALRNLGRWLMIYLPDQDPARSGDISVAWPAFFDRDVLEERRDPRSEMIPGWLLASLRQGQGEQKMKSKRRRSEVLADHRRTSEYTP